MQDLPVERSPRRVVEIEYFIDKKLACTNVTLEQWNKHLHDHNEEVATGRVQVLDVPPEKAKEIAEAASRTDRIILGVDPSLTLESMS